MWCFVTDIHEPTGFDLLSWSELIITGSIRKSGWSDGCSVRHGLIISTSTMLVSRGFFFCDANVIQRWPLIHVDGSF